MKTCGLSKDFDKLLNTDPDTLMKNFKLTKPNSGHHYAMGYLQQHGFCVQKKRVMLSLKRVDGLGQVLHKNKAIHCRTYALGAGGTSDQEEATKKIPVSSVL